MRLSSRLYSWRRRLRDELRGARYLIGDNGVEAIRLASIAADLIKVVYNPFYLIDVARRLIV